MNLRRLLALALVCVLTAAYAARQNSLPSWDTLKASYDYVKHPLAVTETPQDLDGGIETRISFPSADGSIVKGLFIRPRAEGIFPVIVIMHGLGGNKDSMTSHLAPQFLEKGVSVLALDAPFHGERHTKEGDAMLFNLYMSAQKSTVRGDLMAQVHSVDKNDTFSKFFIKLVHGGVLDYRLALDYLDGRKDVDHAHVGLLGYSLGSIMCSILAGVDTRVACAALGVGGDPSLPVISDEPVELQTPIAEVSPSLFIGHVASRPIFMLNGKVDQTIPKSATDRLFNAAGQPKEIKWYDAGHMLPTQAFDDAISWSISKLKS